MFTGIIESIGNINELRGHRVSIDSPWSSTEITLGQSISVHGCCLTVTDITDHQLSFDLSNETLERTNLSQLTKNDSVNLERGMGTMSRFDGHWVTGHIDTKAIVKTVQNTKSNDSTVFIFGELSKHRIHFVPKGSIAINGVSLTVNDVFEDGFSVSIIPYTMQHTTFSKLKKNDVVNIEFDMIGKYILRYLENYEMVRTTHV